MEKIKTSLWEKNIWEQSDWSLVFPSGRIMSTEDRDKLIKSSLKTQVRKKEDLIVDMIKYANSLILIWETWSWKTTELQQIIHETFPKDIILNLIPLVSATIWTTSYVSDILYAKTGNPNYVLGHENSIIWYRTWKWNSSKYRTQINNSTYWVEYLYLILWNLEKLLRTSDKKIHVFLDEIHEKSEDFVFYFKEIIEISKKFPWRIKIYWGSATVSENYLDLITDKLKVLWWETSIIKVKWRSFPIEKIENNWASVIDTTVDLYKRGKSPLVFQPWKAEIQKTIDWVKQILWDKINIYPFHSGISSEELKNILKHNWTQKIYVATNAWRTWITPEINATVDDWMEKNIYYNEFWIDTLIKEPITKDAREQNAWRWWRTEKSEDHYIWNVKIKDLKEEALSSVEKKVDEKKILNAIIKWEDFLKNVKEKATWLIFDPHFGMTKLQYEWMEACGLITKDKKITKYWYDCIKLPLSVYNSRSILESVENNVSDEVIPMVSIMEHNGFIKKEFNLDKFRKNFFDKDYSDLEIYKKLYEILISTQIDDDILNIFVNMWIDRKYINYFKALDWEEKFYNVVKEKLDDIWLSYDSIIKIDETVIKTKDYLWKNNKDLKENDNIQDLNEKRDLIIKSLLAWNMHRIYNSIWDKKLKDYYKNQWDLEFEQSNTSYIELKTWKNYIWVPFIIWGWEDKDDKNIMSFLTEIKEEHIDYYLEKEYSEYKVNIQKLNLKDFVVDNQGDTFITPNYLTDDKNRQESLAENWLPNFLINENPYFKNYINNLWTDFDQDKIISLLKQISFKFSNKIDPNNKRKTEEKFRNDKTILEILIDNKNKKPVIDWKDIKEIGSEKSDFYKYIKSNNDYNKTLQEAKKYINSNKIDVNNIEDILLDSFIKYLENNSEHYAKIIIFIKNMSTIFNKKFRSKIKNEFKTFDKVNKTLINLKKRNSWGITFIENLKKLKWWDNITIEELWLWIINDKNLLLSDPIIRKNNLWDKSKKLQKELKSIKRILNKIDFNKKVSTKLLKSMQRLLFSDKRIFKRWENNFDQIFSDIVEERNNNLEEIKKLKENNSSFWDQSRNEKIKSLNILNDNYNRLLKKLSNFKENILEIRKDINEIDFNNIIFSSSNKNVIYTQKFLYNILIDIIFEWDFFALNIKWEEKIKKWLSIFLKWNNKEINTLELIELIKNITYNKNILVLGKTDVIKEKLDNYIIILEEILKDYKDETLSIEKRLSSEEFENVNNLIDATKWILKTFYPDKIVDINANKFINFSKKVSSFSLNNIDEEIKKLIWSVSLSKTKKFKDEFSVLERYNDLFYEINIQDTIKTSDNSEEDELWTNFALLAEELDFKTHKIKEKTREIKDIVEKFSKNNI